MKHVKRAPDIEKLLSILEAHELKCVLTGSVAAAAYGVAVQPGDLDITPALDAENLRRLAAILREIEAGFDAAGGGHWEIQPDGEKKWVADELRPEQVQARREWAPDPDDPASMDHLFCTRYGNFDVVPELVGTYEALMARAQLMGVCGHAVWVAHVDDLLATLTVPRRQKDAERVRHLRAVQRQRAGVHP